MKKLSKVFLAFGMAMLPLCLNAQNHRWTLEEDGPISWHPQKTEMHLDDIEMSGKNVSVILRYGVAHGKFILDKSINFSASLGISI